MAGNGKERSLPHIYIAIFETLDIFVLNIFRNINVMSMVQSSSWGLNYITAQ